MKLVNWISYNILFLITLLFLAFIPLYPKLPLFNVQHTWVYIRAEDLLVAFAVVLWFIQWIRRKAALSTPLTIPVLLFWGVGFISTLYGILFIFPSLPNVFPNVAILSFLRRVEYLSVFFIGYSAVFYVKQEKNDNNEFIKLPNLFLRGVQVISITYIVLFISYFLQNVHPLLRITGTLFSFVAISPFIGIGLFCLSYVLLASTLLKKRITVFIAVITFTLLLTVGYGFGQRGILVGWEHRFPAYSTMNEEFAKGIPLLISATNRIQSTFAGHYDLAAYLVLLIPIMGSMAFGYRKWYLRVFFASCGVLGLLLLLMTASRVSFMVYLLAVCFMLILQKKKLFIIPVVILSFFLLQSFQGISNRFASTFSQVDVVVDARTGKAIGIAKKVQGKKKIIIEDKQSTGENLPQGSGFINLPTDTSEPTKTQVEYKRTGIKAGKELTEVTNIEGNFVVKKVFAYDVSFTTRFQGEWPRAFEAFRRNMLLGSGYSSINLATDNNYLRILGETGILGFISFGALFLFFSIYAYRLLPGIESREVRSLILGVLAGIFGLGLNATLIDVFEASKVAYILWMLIGITLGILHNYQQRKVSTYKDVLKVITSVPALLIYLAVFVFVVYFHTLSNYFVADDFTWLRWVADCKKVLYTTGLKCEPLKSAVSRFFTDSNGFFYRPGTKLYFLVMYGIFWLDSLGYHVVMLLTHFLVAALFFLFAKKILRNTFFAYLSALFFIATSGNYESLLWISASGHIISSLFILLSLVTFIEWRDRKRIVFLVISVISVFVSTLFYELGIIAPLLVITIDLLLNIPHSLSSLVKRWYYLLVSLPIPLYLFIRYQAHSHWFSGDYSYNLSHLPFNIFGNVFGYFFLSYFGVPSLYYYDILRSVGKENKGITLLFIGFILLIILLAYKFLKKDAEYSLENSNIRQPRVKTNAIPAQDKNNLGIYQGFFVSIVFFIVSLLIFMGLGNLAPRYNYLASAGAMLILGCVLQQFYSRVKLVNRYLALLLIGVISLAFIGYHIKQLYALNKDWQKAGTITHDLLSGFNQSFVVKKAYAPNPTFYFVDVPIRYGTAWVFPVGLSDALWFTFQHDKLTIYTMRSLDTALDAAEGKTNTKVFQFRKDGLVEEVIRSKTIVPVK